MTEAETLSAIKRLIDAPQVLSDAETICKARRVLRERGVDIRANYPQGKWLYWYGDANDLAGICLKGPFSTESACILSALEATQPKPVGKYGVVCRHRSLTCESDDKWAVVEAGDSYGDVISSTKDECERVASLLNSTGQYTQADLDEKVREAKMEAYQDIGAVISSTADDVLETVEKVLREKATAISEGRKP